MRCFGIQTIPHCILGVSVGVLSHVELWAVPPLSLLWTRLGDSVIRKTFEHATYMHYTLSDSSSCVTLPVITCHLS